MTICFEYYVKFSLDGYFISSSTRNQSKFIGIMFDMPNFVIKMNLIPNVPYTGKKKKPVSD